MILPESKQVLHRMIENIIHFIIGHFSRRGKKVIKVVLVL